MDFDQDSAIKPECHPEHVEGYYIETNNQDPSTSVAKAPSAQDEKKDIKPQDVIARRSPDRRGNLEPQEQDCFAQPVPSKAGARNDG